MPVNFRFSDRERRLVGKGISRLGLDQPSIEKRLSALESAANIHLLRDPAVRNAATPMQLNNTVTEFRRVIQTLHKRLVASRLLTSNIGGQNADPKLEASLGRVLSRVDRNLENKLDIIGPPKKRSKSNNSKPSRDLLWEDVIGIWVAAGGKETGKQLADFLVLMTQESAYHGNRPQLAGPSYQG